MINFANMGVTPDTNPDENVTLRTRNGILMNIYKVDDADGAIRFIPVTKADLNLAGWTKQSDTEPLIRLCIAMERLIRIVDGRPVTDGADVARAVAEAVAVTAPDLDVLRRQRRDYPGTDTPRTAPG